MYPGRVISLLLLVLSLALLSSPALATSHIWSQRFGDALDDTGTTVAIDPFGRVVVVGNFYGTVNFGGADLVSAGSSDIFIAKFSSAGSHLWSRRIGGTSLDYPSDVAIDAAGNIIVIGNFSGTVDFGGGNLVSAGSSDIFLAKYYTGGAHQWSQRFGSTGNDAGAGVAIDAGGDVYMTGSFQLTVNFGGGALVSVGNNDVIVAGYSSTGAHQWSQRYGGILSDTATDIVLVEGDVVVTGGFSGSANFGGGNLVSAGVQDIFLARYSSATGAHQWSNRYGGTFNDYAYGVVAGSTGEVTIGGHFGDTANFGGGNLTSVGIFDVYLASYSSAGAHLWSQSFGSAGNEFSFGLAVGSAGELALTGSFTNTVNFGSGNLVSAGGSDAFIAVFESSGTPLWSRGFGGALPDVCAGATLDASGRALVTGYFQDAVDFGGGDLGSAGGTDIFLAKYSPDAETPLITSIADIGNDQGRKVQIHFNRSGVDDPDAATPVTQYVAFRRDDPAPAGTLAAPEPVAPDDVQATGWTEVGSVLAFAETSYGMVVPTIADSTISQGQYYSVFYVRAATDIPNRFFDSSPDSGYSLDNLAPGVPTGLVLATGQLEWDESTAADFDYFTVYGANVDDFGAAAVVDYTVTPAMDVTVSPYAFYFVTATDFSGNESGAGKIATATAVGDAPRRYVLSISAHPNPFNPASKIRYTLPSHGRTIVTIFDVRGTRVASIVDAELAAGVYSERWDGTDERGVRVGSGVYFARVAHGGASRTYKLVLLK